MCTSEAVLPSSVRSKTVLYLLDRVEKLCSRFVLSQTWLREAFHMAQVHADFAYIGKAAGLATVCIYGGSPYSPQESALRYLLALIAMCAAAVPHLPGFAVMVVPSAACTFMACS